MIKPRFDELIHAPTRLSLVSLLAATEWADFKFLRDSAGLSDSALSKQLPTLEEAGYIEIRKSFVGKRPRTSARLTNVGRAAFDQHVAALQEIVAKAGTSVLPRPEASKKESATLLPRKGTSQRDLRASRVARSAATK